PEAPGGHPDVSDVVFWSRSTILAQASQAHQRARHGAVGVHRTTPERRARHGAVGAVPHRGGHNSEHAGGQRRFGVRGRAGRGGQLLSSDGGGGGRRGQRVRGRLLQPPHPEDLGGRSREHIGGQRRFGVRGRAGRGGQLLSSDGGGGGRRGQRVRGRLLQPPHPEDLGGRSREHAGGQRRFGARGRAGRGGQLLVSAGGGGGRRGQRVRGRLLQPPHPEDLGGRSREHAGRQRRFGISAGGAVSTLAGSGDEGYADGQGAAASFWCPAGVAVDGAGNVFVADCYNHRIRKISAGGAVSTLAGSGVSGSSFAHPAFTAHFHRFIGTEQAVDFPQLKHAKCIWEGIIQGFGIECAGKSQERGLRGICRTGVVASVRFDSYAQGSGSSKAAAAHEVH
ncbi:unnamed protein product, partial [Prorocentrum cordatum]